MRALVVAISISISISASAHADDRDAEAARSARDEARSYGLLGPPRPFVPRVSPDTARWISLGTTAAGLGLTAALWLGAGGLDDRGDLVLPSIGAGLATLSIGPAAGLIVAGEYRRGVGGALARPVLAAGGLGGVAVGALVTAWGCFETDDCIGAKIGGGVMIGAGVAITAASLAWGVYDIVDTPRILRRRTPSRVGLAPLVGGDRLGLALAIIH